MLSFVLGTGTGVGKTCFSAALLRLARASGLDAVGLKPAQTGSDEPSDAAHLGEACGTFVEPLYSFPEPVSPHLAARARGMRLDCAAIIDWVSRHQRGFTLVETAGGAFSPLNEESTNADLVERTDPASAIFLVTGAALGTFHATTATLRALGTLAARTIVVVSAPESLTDGVATADELRRLRTAGLSASALVLGPNSQLVPGSEARLIDGLRSGRFT
ncbi:MAG: dethiobiotin synthase [Polyangiaceae bacterium]|nr:dethiobiotin synthase [Polyangiaceae bacterium]MBK8938326.1 dethiobiotin synthase [Polyangiaceae bacterium]